MVCLRLSCVLSHSLGNEVLYSNLLSRVYKTRSSRQTINQVKSICRTTLNYSTQSDRLYTPKHEWIQVSGNIGIVGISHYAQEALGDVVFAQLPEVGDKIEKDAEVGALESVKSASELYSPVSGAVVDKNTEVEATPGLINKSCYEKGWLFKVELSKPEELKELFDEGKYSEFLKTDHNEEAH